MKTEFTSTPRIFKATEKIVLRDFGKIQLEPDEMITFVDKERRQYDFVAKEWGYYATPSINGRLKQNGFKTALVKNSYNKFFILIVDKDKIKEFEHYLKEDNQSLIEWLDERE